MKNDLSFSKILTDMWTIIGKNVTFKCALVTSVKPNACTTRNKYLNV